MLRLLRYLFLAVIAVLLMVFASANRDLVTLHALPPDLAYLFTVDWQMDVPAFLLVFLGIVVGLLVGYTLEWLREHKHRRTARTQTRVVSKLERELAAMKDQTSLPDDDVLALLEKPKR
jgi:putative membrane protein